jgi:hypothetical protein
MSTPCRGGTVGVIGPGSVLAVRTRPEEGTMTSKTVVLLSAAACSALLLTAPSPASAHVSSVTSRSTCTQGTHAMLTLSHDDGHVEAEIELHADHARHTWKLRFYNEKTLALTVSRRAGAEGRGGTLSESRLLTNHAGKDLVTVTATNTVTRERCVVRATV